MHSKLFRSIILIALILPMGLFALTRDVNTYILAGAAVLLSISFVMLGLRRHATARAILIVSIAAWLIVVGQLRSQHVGERWVMPLTNVISKRILPNPDAVHFFAEKGAPFDDIPEDKLPIYCQEDCGNMHRFLQTDPDGQRLLEWVREAGKTTYLLYLIQNPGQSVLLPLTDLPSMISPDSTEYRLNQYLDPLWVGAARRWFVPRPTALILVWSAAFLLGCTILLLKKPNYIHLALPAAMILLSLFSMYVIWHGDAIELERHATQSSLQLKVNLWIGSGFLIDHILNRKRTLTNKVTDSN